MSSGKRLFHGAAAWRSQKIARLPDWMKSEHAWMFSIANDYGCFEADPAIVCSTCYSFSRRNITQEQIAEMLDAFHEVGLLFRWKDDQGRECGFWTGSEKAGRLPAPSERAKADKEFPQPPRDQLLAYEGRQRLGSSYGQPTEAVSSRESECADHYQDYHRSYEVPTDGVGIASLGLVRLGEVGVGVEGDIYSGPDPQPETVQHEPIPEEDDEQWTRELAQLHPSLENPQETYRAIFDAIGTVMRDHKMTKAEAKAHLWERTKRYREVAADYPEEQKKYIKGSHTWFRNGCYCEDDSVWLRRGRGNANGNGTASKAEQRERANLAAREQVIAAVEERESQMDDSPTREAGSGLPNATHSGGDGRVYGSPMGHRRQLTRRGTE